MAAEFLHQYEIFQKKASADLKAAEVLFNADDVEIDLAVVFFHLQQTAEKLLKALISRKGVHFEKLHDIRRLIDICCVNAISLPDYVEAFVELNPFAVEGRYAIMHDEFADAGHFIGLLRRFEAEVKTAIDGQEKHL